MKKRALSLMKKWCDRLLDFTVSSTRSPYTDGGIICPACHVIHGRIGELALPLTVLWDKTGQTKYLDAASSLVEWSQFNLSRPDGSWRNDAGNEWKATSAFAAMASPGNRSFVRLVDGPLLPLRAAEYAVSEKQRSDRLHHTASPAAGQPHLRRGNDGAHLRLRRRVYRLRLRLDDAVFLRPGQAVRTGRGR